MLNLEFLGWAGGNGDSAHKPNTCDAEQVRGECSFLDSSIALLLCSDRPSLPSHGEYCSPSLGELQAREGKKPFLLGVGTGGKSTSQQQSHCWELVVAAQLIYLQPCKTITNFKCTWDLSPAKSPEFININQQLLTVSVVALKHVGLKAFPQEILQRNWNEFPH